LIITPLLFFFFQAEDGIRDGHVTGVQTCALPIYENPRRTLMRTPVVKRQTLPKSGFSNFFRCASSQASSASGNVFRLDFRLLVRSEERRVGKECRFWWWGCQLKRRSYIVMY